jgi:hypothetical protein
MRKFGWVVTVVVGGYASWLFLRSIPDMARYAKMSMK